MINVNEKFIEEINSMEEVMVEIESAGEIRYCHIQESDGGGYDYTYFGEDCCEIDGGNYETEGQIGRMGNVLDDILDTETECKGVIIRILSEEEMEDVLDAEYDDMFGEDEDE